MLRLPEWRSRAACRGRLDLDFIDPAPEQVAECRALCARCPVLDQCRAEALTAGEAWGIWGGLNADERESLAVQEGHPVPAVLPAHATNARYAKHGCRCALCRDAHTSYERARRERRRRGDPWTRSIVLAAPVRNGRSWVAAGQYVLPLPGVPASHVAEAIGEIACAAACRRDRRPGRHDITARRTRAWAQIGSLITSHEADAFAADATA